MSETPIAIPVYLPASRLILVMIIYKDTTSLSSLSSNSLLVFYLVLTTLISRLFVYYSFFCSNWGKGMGRETTF